jgi:pyruvate/2-oxoglutarate dehydrogenase complex dihydrolipoamide acyltransferase (E2) component
VERIVAAIRRSVSTKTKREVVAAVVSTAQSPRQTLGTSASSTKTDKSKQRRQKIIVPIMGEGIRAAKVVSLLKQPGDQIQHDDPLCEVETDKAVYPIESSFAGTMGEWKIEIGANVEIGEELGTILVEGEEGALEEQIAQSAEVCSDQQSNGAADVSGTESRRVTPRKSDGIEPALSPTITRRLNRVVPANLQMDARWDAIRKAREAAKKKNGKDAPSPSVMLAWAVVRAMERHAPFRRLMLEDDQIIENDEFDLGIAVALDDDRLATAVVTRANKRNWPDFVKRYSETVDETRAGRVDAVNAPVVISSLGAFGVRTGAPIVVPPSVGTLFIGTAHNEVTRDGKKNQTTEVITLSLTFDHRVVNGAGAANFVHDIKKEVENFKIPKATALSS